MSEKGLWLTLSLAILSIVLAVMLVDARSSEAPASKEEKTAKPSDVVEEKDGVPSGMNLKTYFDGSFEWDWRQDSDSEEGSVSSDKETAAKILGDLLGMMSRLDEERARLVQEDLRLQKERDSSRQTRLDLVAALETIERIVGYDRALLVSWREALGEAASDESEELKEERKALARREGSNQRILLDLAKIRKSLGMEVPKDD